jgi:small-conductance mechanosensitive channel
MMVESFGDATLAVVFSVWTATGNYFELKESLMLEIKDAFDKNGITAPAPALGSATTLASAPSRT